MKKCEMIKWEKLSENGLDGKTPARRKMMRGA